VKFGGIGERGQSHTPLDVAVPGCAPALVGGIDGGLLDKLVFGVGVGHGNFVYQAFRAARTHRLISPDNPSFKIRATELWLLK
jgi:hypothetical protein